jgi:hypothetical protein
MASKYFAAEDGLTDSRGRAGFERGTYTWNATTGAFSTKVINDTNGAWGFSNAGIVSLTYSSSADTLTASNGLIFSRVRSLSSLVGGWELTDPGDTQYKGTLITFLDDLSYYVVRDVAPTEHPGMQRGRYTSVAGLLTTSMTTVTDTSGQAGNGSPRAAEVFDDIARVVIGTNTLPFGRIAP